MRVYARPRTPAHTRSPVLLLAKGGRDGRTLGFLTVDADGFPGSMPLRVGRFPNMTTTTMTSAINCEYIRAFFEARNAGLDRDEAAGYAHRVAEMHRAELLALIDSAN